MTRTLLKLQATLWKRTVVGNSAAIVMIALVVIYGLIGLFSFMVMLSMGLAEGTTGLLAGVVATGTIAYVIAAIMWPSGEGQVHPAALAVMPIEAKKIMPALAIATLMQSRGIIALVCTVTTGVVASVFYPAAMIPVVWLMLVLALMMTLLLGELISSFGSATSSRGTKERMSLYASLGFMVLIIAYQLFASQGSAAHLDAFGDIARWTPFASTAGAIEAAVAGQWLLAVTFIGLSLLYVAGGFWLWVSFISKALTAPLDSGGGGASKARNKTLSNDQGKRALPFRNLPWTPFWAVYSRSLLYLFRDSRLLAAMITFPMLGVIFVVQSFTIDSFMIYVGLIFLAIFSGAVATNDFGYDGPSTWINIISGAPARALLLGRHVAQMTPAVVFLLVYAVIAVIVADNVVLTLLIIGITVGLLATTAGVALYTTTFNPFATAKPGTSPWGDRSGYSGAAFISAFATMLLGWIPSLPAIVLTIWGYSTGTVWAMVLGQILALLLPGMLYLLAIGVCTKRVDNHMPEIFDKVKRHVG